MRAAAVGSGEGLLPRADITLCEQMVLIGSGMIWNVYFASFSILLGFCFATALALGKASRNPWLSGPSRSFIYLFRGTPLFIQFFFVYELFVLLPRVGVEIDLGVATIEAGTHWLTRAWGRRALRPVPQHLGLYRPDLPWWRADGGAARRRRGRQLFRRKDLQPFVAYPIVGAYFILGTVGIIAVFGAINARLNRHMAPGARTGLSFHPQFMR